MRAAAALNHLLHATSAVVLAGGRGSRLKQLTEWRSKPAMPFGGHLKIVDFTLSNCVNSGVRRISVLTQYKAQSLIRHVTRAWGFLDAGLGEYVDVVPAQQQIDQGWYRGTADAVYQNLALLRDAAPRLVLVLAGDHVYKMDYGRLLADHVEHGADVTVACVEAPLEQARCCGVVQVGAGGRVTAFAEKPAHPAPMPGRADRALVSMGIYVFDAEVLYRALQDDAADAASSHDFGFDILPRAVRTAHVRVHDFAASCVNIVDGRPYWRDVGTIQAYWEANLDLTRPLPELNLYDEAWPIRGAPQHLAPAKFVFDDDGRRGVAIDSLVSGGCIVSGSTVRRSVLFARSRVGDGSLVEDSLVLPGAVVGRNVVLERTIVDKRCVIPDGMRIGVNAAEDRAHFNVTETGLVLVTPSMLAPRDAGASPCPARGRGPG
jgi:glucose-1-phosphate adenylyltransferase